MQELGLPLDERYDTTTQGRIAYTVAQMDDQLRRLCASVDGLGVDVLEWQPAPGMNTIGMLLAHVAVAEVWWLHGKLANVQDRETADGIIRGIIGINASDDGMPVEEEGGHPDALRDRDVRSYLEMVLAARAATHDVLLEWQDDDLEAGVELGGLKVTRGWILYHLHEHLTAHYGQILMLLHQARTAGVLPASS